MVRETPSAGDTGRHIMKTAFKWAVGIFLMITVGFLLGLTREVPPGPDSEAE